MNCVEFGPVTVGVNSAQLSWTRPEGADSFLVEPSVGNAFNTIGVSWNFDPLRDGRKITVTVTPSANDPEIPPGPPAAVEFVTRLQAPVIEQCVGVKPMGAQGVQLGIRVTASRPCTLLVYRDGEHVYTLPVPFENMTGYEAFVHDYGENSQGLPPGEYSYRAGLVNEDGATSELSEPATVTLVEA